mgnify:CR=1 FL=1
MAISELRVWSSIYTTTLDDVRDEIPDQVHNHIVLTWFMRNKGRGKDRGDGAGRGFRFQNGGAKIRIPVVLEKNNNTKWYSRYEAMNVNPTDEITNGIDVMRQLSQTVGISGDELDSNSGDAAKFNLLEEKMDIGEMGEAEKLETALVQGVASGTRFIADAGGKAVLPLGYLIQKDFTNADLIHEIPQVTETDWRNRVVVSAAGAPFATFRKEMTNLYNTTSLGSSQDTVDLILSDQNYHEFYEGILAILQRYPYDAFENDNAPSAGFRALRFKNAVVMFSQFVPNYGNTAGDAVSLTQNAAQATAFFINTRQYEIVVSRKVNFAVDPFVVPYDQDAMWSKILWRGQACMLQRRKHGLHLGVDTTQIA